jgi:hypothetical protein
MDQSDILVSVQQSSTLHRRMVLPSHSTPIQRKLCIHLLH